MALNIRKGPKIRPPRILLLGTEKAGKSTFPSKADNPFYIPISGEEGIDDLDVESLDEPIKTFDEFMETLRDLYAGDYDYKTLVIDSVSALQPIIFNEICKEYEVDNIENANGGWSKCNSVIEQYIGKIIRPLDMLRNKKEMTIVLIGHTIVKQFNDPMGESYDVYKFDVHKNISSILKRWADVTLFASQKSQVKTEDVGFNKTKGRSVGESERKLITRGHLGCPADGRGVYGHLPKVMDLDWDVFKAQVALTVKKRKGESQDG